MSAAELTAVLNTVERDHLLALEKMQALKDAVNCLLEPGEIPLHNVLGRLRDSNEFFASQFEFHLEEARLTSELGRRTSDVGPRPLETRRAA